MSKYIWSKGPYINFYSSYPTEKITEEIILKQIIYLSNGSLLWIRNGNIYDDDRQKISDLEIVSKNLDLITKPTILITTDGDRSVPSTYKPEIIMSIINCDQIIKWYTQNYDKSVIHPKIKHFPIGFDLHFPLTMVGKNYKDKLDFMFNCRIENMDIDKIDNQIFCDAHLNTTSPERKTMHYTLQFNKNIKFLKERTKFTDITKLYNKYLFVLSPVGNGLDCHRTWELFLAGCIVITKHSPLDEIFIDNQLPVVLIEDWYELNINLSEKLKLWKEQFLKNTDFEHIKSRLKFNYWLNK